MARPASGRSPHGEWAPTWTWRWSAPASSAWPRRASCCWRHPHLSLAGAGARGRDGHAPDRPQLRRPAPGVYYKPGSLKAPPVRGGRARAVRLLRGQRDPVRALRQADRGHRAGRAGAGWTSSSGAASPTACPACARLTAIGSPRSSRTLRASRRCTRRETGIVDYARGGGRLRGRRRGGRRRHRDRLRRQACEIAVAAGRIACAHRTARRGRGTRCSAPAAGPTGWR